MELPVRKLFKEYLVFSQVPFGLKRIDLVFTSCDLQKPIDEVELISVELKCSKWKESLRQSYVNQLCADKSYVAIPEENIRMGHLPAFAKHGIGLIAVNGVARIVVEASPREYLDVRFKKKLLEEIRRIMRRQKVLYYDQT